MEEKQNKTQQKQTQKSKTIKLFVLLLQSHRGENQIQYQRGVLCLNRFLRYVSTYLKY